MLHSYVIYQPGYQEEGLDKVAYAHVIVTITVSLWNHLKKAEQTYFPAVASLPLP